MSAMNEERRERIANAAAEYWAGVLEQKGHPGDKIEVFRKDLAARIVAELTDWSVRLPNDTPWIKLENDYDPRGDLLDALHAAGFECRGMMFSGDPFFYQKTRMWIEGETIEVAEGYAAPRVTIYPTGEVVTEHRDTSPTPARLASQPKPPARLFERRLTRGGEGLAALIVASMDADGSNPSTGDKI